MPRCRPLEDAVALVRDAVVAQQSGEFGGGEWFVRRVRRRMTATTSRGDRERLVAHLAMLAASMAQRVPDQQREQVFDDLVSVSQLSAGDAETLRELARFGMVG